MAFVSQRTKPSLIFCIMMTLTSIAVHRWLNHSKSLGSSPVRLQEELDYTYHAETLCTIFQVLEVLLQLSALMNATQRNSPSGIL